ncbi:MAG: RidA family protein [Actinobacteria bacterium]|nr:RidA family protein [Actinomycetota bacterium]
MPISPISQAIKAGGFVYTSGQLGRALTGGPLSGLGPQARQALKNIEAVIRAAGGSMRDVVRIEAYVTDLSQVGEFNEAFKEAFPEEPPARFCVEVSRLAAGALIEITAVAYVGSR